MEEPKRKKSLSTKLLLVLWGLIIGCLMAEISLRIIGYSYPIFYITDYERGYAPRPNVEGWFWVENKVYVRINGEGFRDREHSKAKPADTVRIAVLGDSFAEARQVPMEQTFWAVMEQRLQSCPALAGKKVEVLNFGVGGYGTAQELLTLRQRVWDYSPDIVILAVTTYNDIIDNYRPFKQTEEIPYFFYRNDQLVYDSSFRDSPTYRWHDSRMFRAWEWLHNHSCFIQLLHHAQYNIRTRISDWRARRALSQSQAAQPNTPQSQQTQSRTVSAEDVGLNNMIYVEPDDTWKEAWRLTEGLIKQTRDEVERRGAKFLFVTISTDIQVYPKKAVRQALINRLGTNDLLYPNHRLQALADREGIAFLDLAEPMQAYADQNGVFLHGFGNDAGNGHWNDAGHRLAGDLISQKLCAQDFLR
ncbi:MAG TPA: SGNH/GDSL hydrolase family protein [Pyrinomonadaceae bacterium]|nr:SGNH/GDSL hydrolase family protein [Pyrinomonadaceae bacterium]